MKRLGAWLGWACAGALAVALWSGRGDLPVAEGQSGFQGVVRTDGVTEQHKWKDRQHRTARVDRTQVWVPASYGDLYSITGDGAASMLWFRDTDGRVRNVMVNGLVQLERVTTSDR